IIDIKNPTLFFNSHDLRRSATRLFNNDKQLQVMSFALNCFLNGALIIYQGEEFGMEDTLITNINEMNDVQGLNEYDKLIKSNNEEIAFHKALLRSRDYSRSMVLWENSLLKQNSWIKHSSSLSIQEDVQQPFSVYKNYHSLIKLRNKGLLLQEGSISFNLVSEDIVVLRKYRGTNSSLIYLNYKRKHCIIKYNEKVIYEI
ncbi:MAG: alpha-amylase family glycosyl hydrolase, partial [Bacilli bacterium]